MKYKVGDKFLQEIEVGEVVKRAPCPYKMLPYGGEWSEAALDGLRRPDDMTAEEAWEIAKKIILHPDNGGYTTLELEEIFGRHSSMMIFKNNTPQQAKAIIEAWKSKKEIKVGDEITAIDDDGNKMSLFVQKIIEDTRIKYWGIIHYADGTIDAGFISHGDDVKKTGRHIDIQSVLDQIGGVDK